jgi:predicted O-methyltransferase YrrM
MKTPILSDMIEMFSEKLNLYEFRRKLATSILYRLTKKEEKCRTLSERINLYFKVFQNVPLNYVGWSISPLQIRAEMETLLTKLTERKIRVMLEIGTAQGGTLYLFTRILNSDAEIVSLDLPDGDFVGSYPSYKKAFYASFARDNQRIFLVKANSHEKSSLETVKSILEGKKLDFLFIDGDHSYEGVQADFKMYGPLVREGGLIAFHDICQSRGTGLEYSGTVFKFWKETRKMYPYEEIINNPNQDGYGIGIIYW